MIKMRTANWTITNLSVAKMARSIQRRSLMEKTDSLAVLLTNISLSGRSGTEIVTRDLALGLRRRGHRPLVYTRDASGPIADELQGASIPVFSDITTLTAPLDIIHGHHTPTTAIAVSKYPKVPAIFVAHDFTAWFDTSPDLGSIRKLCAVDTTVAQRFSVYEGRDPSEIFILLNAVDMERFQPGPVPGSVPRRALAFAKNTNHLQAIRQACELRNIDLDVVGAAVDKVISSPETELANYDLVFASALSALEAMACGRAVIVCDGRGLAGFVTPNKLQNWRQKNFGLGCFTKRLSTENFLAEIDRYDAGIVGKIMAYIRKEADQEVWLDKIENLYRQIMQDNASSPSQTSFSELSSFFQTWAPRIDPKWPWLLEREKLIEELSTAKIGVQAPEFGEEMFLSQPSETSKIQLVEGFSDRESWGVWSIAEAATILTRRPKEERVPQIVRFVVQQFFWPQRPAQEVSVLVNGQKCADWKFVDADESHHYTFTCQLPPSAKSEQVWITFQISDPRSPYECGVSNDKRRLGLGLISVSFE